MSCDELKAKIKDKQPSTLLLGGDGHGQFSGLKYRVINYPVIPDLTEVWLGVTSQRKTFREIHYRRVKLVIDDFMFDVYLAESEADQRALSLLLNWAESQAISCH